MQHRDVTIRLHTKQIKKLMLNYFVDSYMWCFFLKSQCWKCREFLCKCEQKQGQGTKEKDKLYLFAPYCFLSTKQNSSSLLPSSKPEFALAALPIVFWHLFCGFWGCHLVTALTLPIFCLSSKVSYIEPLFISNSVHKSAVFLIFKCKESSYWSKLW